MADILDKVIDTAKKLRKVAKKIDNDEAQDLIVDLNLHLADLKVAWAELRWAEQHPQADAATAEPAAEPEPAASNSEPERRPTPIPPAASPTFGI